jgi:hypothetical protein
MLIRVIQEAIQCSMSGEEMTGQSKIANEIPG